MVSCRRYAVDKIYTYIGDILVAVNPFRPLQMYERKSQLLYRNALRQAQQPHIYAIADAAYSDMVKSKGNKSQCCIVSGESGAGKTESAKYIVRQLMLLCSQDHAASIAGSLESKILSVSGHSTPMPLL